MTTETDNSRSYAPYMDIAIVFGGSMLAIWLEGLAVRSGAIAIASEASGISGVLVGVIATLAVVYYRERNLRSLGFRKPERWATVPLWVVGILGLYALAQSFLPPLISNFVEVPEPDISKYDAIVGNLGAAVSMALILPFTASIPEEIIYRGFLIGRLEQIFGSSVRGSVLAVSLQALIFGLAHYQWGPGGMLITVFMGLIWGFGYILCGRNLWIVILAHSAGHLLFVYNLYTGGLAAQ
ncbi:MAG: type II CAAX endopeptidase family protein [Woeseiaceae bacterium]|nr:type II CAAX endopeptidase family protein [Woeseiaceae bacterium]